MLYYIKLSIYIYILIPVSISTHHHQHQHQHHHEDHQHHHHHRHHRHCHCASWIVILLLLLLLPNPEHLIHHLTKVNHYPSTIMWLGKWKTLIVASRLLAPHPKIGISIIAPQLPADRQSLRFLWRFHPPQGHAGGHHLPSLAALGAAHAWRPGAAAAAPSGPSFGGADAGRNGLAQLHLLLEDEAFVRWIRECSCGIFMNIHHVEW